MKFGMSSLQKLSINRDFRKNLRTESHAVSEGLQIFLPVIYAFFRRPLRNSVQKTSRFPIQQLRVS